MLNAVMRTAAVALAVLMSAVGFVDTAQAADSADGSADDKITWMVRPSDGVGMDGRSWIEHELAPGTTVQEHLLVRNMSSTPVTFGLSAADGYFTDTGRFNMLTSDQPSSDAGQWITIQPTIEVQAGAEAIVPFTISVPSNATPGDHPAGVAAVIRSSGDKQIGVESRVGFRVMTRVAGELQPAATVKVNGAYNGSWNPFNSGEVHLNYELANSGNAILTITPQLTITALFGLVSFTTTGDAIAQIAPGESRTGEITIPGTWPLLVYATDIDATMGVSVNGTDQISAAGSASASTVVWAFPLPQAIALLMTGFFVWWLWADRRRRDRKLESLLTAAREEVKAELANNP